MVCKAKAKQNSDLGLQTSDLRLLQKTKNSLTITLGKPPTLINDSRPDSLQPGLMSDVYGLVSRG